MVPGLKSQIQSWALALEAESALYWSGFKPESTQGRQI